MSVEEDLQAAARTSGVSSFRYLYKTQFIQHFQIETCSLLETLSFYQFVVFVKIVQSSGKLGFDGFDCPQSGAAWCDVMTGRVNRVTRYFCRVCPVSGSNSVMLSTSSSNREIRRAVSEFSAGKTSVHHPVHEGPRANSNSLR